MRVNIDHSEGVSNSYFSKCIQGVGNTSGARVGLQSYVVTRSDLMWVSHSGTAKLKIH